jgi:mannose-6-phosphate isomerase-like protein (cupin superfamily)
MSYMSSPKDLAMLCGDESRPFSQGDIFVVAAGVEHHFTDFSNNFATWTIFLRN